MNSDTDRDSVLLDQIDRALEHGIPADDALLKDLTTTVPKASIAFQQDLEHKLIAQIISPQFRKSKEKNRMQLLMSTFVRPRLQRHTAAWTMTWVLTVTTAALIAVILINWKGIWPPAVPAATFTQIDTPGQIVIAAQDIPAGTAITADMIGSVMMSAEDLAKLTAARPERAFLPDITRVIGQTAARDIHWFQPIEASFLGEVDNLCNLPGKVCPEIPQGYAVINLLLEPDTLHGLTLQGLMQSYRVDVLAALEGEVRVVAANVLLVNVESDRVTLAAPYWKHSVLVWLYNSEVSYTLRLYTGSTDAVAFDSNMVEYTFTAPETLPDGYTFDLLVTLPASEGYRLSGLPASIDHIQFSGPDSNLTFWFTDLEVVRIVEGTSVTIRLPKMDADNLAYLIENQARLGFIPDAG